MLALSNLADMASNQKAEFEPDACYDDNFDETPCSAGELAEQRQEWEAEQERQKADNARSVEMYKTMVGDYDLSDPAAGEEIASTLRRQAGWNSVEYKGNGLFVVDFSINTQISHDFTFPTIERMRMANAFVTANLRSGNVVKIDAPGFSPQAMGANPMMGALSLAAMSRNDGEGDEEPETPAPELSGTLTVTTDGEILTNNTDEGPVLVSNGQQLNWTINRRSTAAPTALIRIGN